MKTTRNSKISKTGKLTDAELLKKFRMSDNNSTDAKIIKAVRKTEKIMNEILMAGIKMSITKKVK
jgi:hypothetical protein